MKSINGEIQHGIDNNCVFCNTMNTIIQFEFNVILTLLYLSRKYGFFGGCKYKETEEVDVDGISLTLVLTRDTNRNIKRSVYVNTDSIV